MPRAGRAVWPRPAASPVRTMDQSCRHGDGVASYQRRSIRRKNGVNLTLAGFLARNSPFVVRRSASPKPDASSYPDETRQTDGTGLPVTRSDPRSSFRSPCARLCPTLPITLAPIRLGYPWQSGIVACPIGTSKSSAPVPLDMQAWLRPCPTIPSIDATYPRLCVQVHTSP